jgi:hypothetical protein
MAGLARAALIPIWALAKSPTLGIVPKDTAPAPTSTATTKVSGSFTPVANTKLYAAVFGQMPTFVAFTIAISGTGGLTWTLVDSEVNAATGASSIYLWEASVGASPSAQTVTFTATQSVYMAHTIFSAVGNNVSIKSGQIAHGAANDGATTLTTGSLPAATTPGNLALLIAGANRDSATAIPTPAGFLPFVTSSGGGAFEFMRVSGSWTSVISSTSYSLATDNEASLAILIELQEASSGIALTAGVTAVTSGYSASMNALLGLTSVTAVTSGSPVSLTSIQAIAAGSTPAVTTYSAQPTSIQAFTASATPAVTTYAGTLTSLQAMSAGAVAAVTTYAANIGLAFPLSAGLTAVVTTYSATIGNIQGIAAGSTPVTSTYGASLTSKQAIAAGATPVVSTSGASLQGLYPMSTVTPVVSAYVSPLTARLGLSSTTPVVSGYTSDIGLQQAGNFSIASTTVVTSNFSVVLGLRAAIASTTAVTSNLQTDLTSKQAIAAGSTSVASTYGFGLNALLRLAAGTTSVTSAYSSVIGLLSEALPPPPPPVVGGEIVYTPYLGGIRPTDPDAGSTLITGSGSAGRIYGGTTADSDYITT